LRRKINFFSTTSYTSAMKNFFACFAFVCLLFAGSQLQAQNNNGFIGRAIAAYNTQCGNYNGPIEGSAGVISACFAGGFITEVTLVPKVNCQQIDCSLIRLAPLARVYFGCDNEIISIECLN
jgi:hypothetical protein